MTSQTDKALQEAAHAAILRALDEASVQNETLRGMCVEVGLDAFNDALASAQAQPAVGVAMPDGWSIRREGQALVVQKAGLGGYVATDSSENIASIVLHALAADMLAAQAEAPAAVGEPVFLVATGLTHEGQELYTRHEGSPPPLCEFERLCSDPPAQPAEPAAVAVPEGWQLVPMSPTDEMIDATYHGQPLADIWHDMLKAAPPAPAATAEESLAVERLTRDDLMLMAEQAGVAPNTISHFEAAFLRFAKLLANALAAAAPENREPQPQVQDEADAFLEEVRVELKRARSKFPGDRIMTIALAEEFGELCKAVLDESSASVRKEAVQTAVMACRVAIDGDGSVNTWREEKGLDPLTASAQPQAQKGGA